MVRQLRTHHRVDRLEPGPGAGDGNRRLAALYDELLPTVYGYARARLPVADAEDVTADVFRAAAELLRADPAAPLRRAWFVTAVRNRIIDHWRHETRWRARLPVLRVDCEDVTVWLDAPDCDRVADALDRLAPGHRAVLVLRYVDGLSTKEIAVALRRTPAAVDSLLARARRALVASFEEVGA